MDQKERFERYKYLTGLSSWEVASYQDKDNVVILNDGPSGLRKPLDNDFNHQQDLITTVCIPTPSALAASFDEEIVYQASKIIALECLYNKTNILLAPGVNIKKYVLCGRNFEYFSEDPYLAGKLAAAYVNGLEDHGVGATLKHYACNSQEFARTINNSNVSLRALNEIYLRVFKYILKYSHPTAVMTSYNKVNNEYVSESSYLINKKLRKEYKFNGLIMSDWCGISDKGKSIKTGINLEMPRSKMSYEFMDRGYGKDFFDKDLSQLDKVLNESICKFKEIKRLKSIDLESLHNDAIRIANCTITLVKNDYNYLPLQKEEKILVLGYFANHSRFVGNGSGFVNAYKKESFIEILDSNHIKYDFVECYDENNINISIDDLRVYQGQYDKVVLFLGQYQFDESEGIDRQSIELRKQQLETLRIVKEVFDQFAVVITTGSVVNIKDVYQLSSSVLISYLAGEGQANAIFNNLFALHNPSGRLPETWISDIKQNPHNLEHLKRDIYQTLYTDDIYVGYRYYDLHHDGFILPFGYGLSYSKFSYSNIRYQIIDHSIIVRLKITNESDIDGEDVIEVFIGKNNSKIYRPVKELKGFKKTFIKKHQSIDIDINIDIDNLKSYRQLTDSFELEDGDYQIYLAKNSDHIIDNFLINLKGVPFEEIKAPDSLPHYEIQDVITFDSPAGLLFENKYFKKYVKENQLPIDLNNFEKRYFYVAEKALRVTIGDGDFHITFEQLEDLINYLNQHQKGISKIRNFDAVISRYLK